MKKLFLLCAGLLVCLQLQAQLANPGFELRNADGTAAYWQPASLIAMPIDTNCSWIGLDSIRHITTDAHTGNYAMELRVATYCAAAISGNIRPVRYNVDSFTDQRVPFTQRPAAFTFYHKLFSIQGDGALVQVTLEGLNGNVIANGVLRLQQPATGWSQASIPLAYYSNDVPELMRMSFTLQSDSVLHYGTRFLIDDISHTAATGIVAATPAYEALSCFPVPAKEQLSVRLNNLPGHTTAQIFITDATGRLLRGEVTATQGNGMLHIDVKELPQGIYFIRVQAGRIRGAGRFIK